MTNNSPEPDMQQLLEHLTRLLAQPDDLPDQETPLGRLTSDFLAGNWELCADGLLSRTKLIRVQPEYSPAPRVFHFEIDTPYKRKLGPDAPVELMPGPVRGAIHYRGDMFEQPDLPYVAVQMDPSLAFFHPNCSRQRGHMLCLGDIPLSLFPISLDLLLETRIYPIVTYQDRRPAHPLDIEAARYFALDPTAMDGLEPAAPLY